MTYLYHIASIRRKIIPHINEEIKKGIIVRWRQNDT